LLCPPPKRRSSNEPVTAHRLRDAVLTQYARLPVRSAEVSGPQPTILLVRPDHIGDVLFLGPGLHRLRQSLPLARLVLAVGPWARAAAEHLPGIDDVMTVPFPSFDRSKRRRIWEPYAAIEDWAQALRELAPWLAVILRDDDWWSALACQRAGITQRLGAVHDTIAPYLSDRLELKSVHWVQRNGELMGAAATMLGGTPPPAPLAPKNDPLLWTNDDRAAAEAESLLKSLGVESAFLCIAPGSGAPVKLWPVSRWIAVGRSLVEKYRMSVVVAGSTEETEQVDQVASGIGPDATSIAGRTSLPELAEVFRRARLVLGPDSGPLHLAVAVGTPTIHLYGPSSVEQFGPWGDPGMHRIIRKDLHCPDCGNLSLRRPSGAGCMLAIDVDDVVGPACELLRTA